MGRNNRHRRATGSSGARPNGGPVLPPSDGSAEPGRSTPITGPSVSHDADRKVVTDAALAELWERSHGARPTPRPFLEARVERHLGAMTPAELGAVEHQLEVWLRNELVRTAERHWDVADLHHTVSRRLAAPHDDLLLRFLFRAATDEHDQHPTPSTSRTLLEVTSLLEDVGEAPASREDDILGRRRLEEAGGRLAVWSDAVELLQLLFRTPELPRVGPAADDLRGLADLLDGSVGLADRKLLDRVRALLSKAESTTFPEEADALTAKAQELMARHAIDQAMVDASGAEPGAVSGFPTSRRIWIDNPYADGKSLLFHHVAVANRCRAVFFRSLGFMTVIGYRADLDAVDLLFTSLLVQADTGIREAGSQVDRSGRSRTRSFRSSFWVAFASRIGERLEDAVAATVQEAAVDHGDALLPVLASREDLVEAHMEELFPNATQRGVVASNQAGWHAGTQAADRADLGIRKPIRSST